MEAGSTELDNVQTPSLPSFRQRLTQRGKGWMNALAAIAALYLFLVAISLIGHGMKTIATVPQSEAYLKQNVFSLASQPLAGLCIGILLTAFVQSSSFTTSFAVTLVAAPGSPLTLEMAIPIIMGANIGTTITAVLVSLAHVRRRFQFRRSLSAAILHDMFNLLCVLVLLPLEIAFGILSRPARALANWLEGTSFVTTNPKQFAFFKMAVKPVHHGFDWLLKDVFGLSSWPTVVGAIEAAIAVILLFVALLFLVKMLHGLIKDRMAGLFSRTIFRNAGTSFGVGIVATAIVQSSSVTTSLVVPLVGAGILKLRQVFPYMMGANIGTTITAILAGLAAIALAAGTGSAAQAAAACGLALAAGHLLFNIYGTALFWPLQWIPLSITKGYAKLASRRRLLAAVYILTIFFLLPVLIIIIVNW